VSVALSVAGPAAAGAHEHFAKNGVTVVVATLSQPTMRVLPTENATFPGALVVATMIAGSSPKTVLPPDSVMVGAVAAAKAEELPTIALADRAIAAIKTVLLFFFIALLL